MNKDTSADIEKKYEEMIMNKTPQERIKDSLLMLDLAKKMIIASIGKDQNVRQELFLRLYGDDFDEDTKKKILKQLN